MIAGLFGKIVLNNTKAAVVSDVFLALIFNHPVVVKVIDYYAYTIGAPESLWTSTDYIVSDFGLIQRDVEFSAPYYFIRGAIIDSVLYGTVTSIEDAEDIGLPQTFILHQNYPNPFNSATTIQYELGAVADVNLTAYDLLGRHVQTLVNSRQSVGRYKIEFDAGELSSGVYLYRLKINRETISTRKMILLR